ncbi:MAG: ABC transporter permease [Planctomycetes bacterium]|nr:ABC transporter permease [Planctomycetota bacterium]
MTLLRFILRSLWHYRRTNAAVVAGAAVGVAVVAGSLVVGDSFTGSLRDLTLDRLGRADYALIAPDFFRAALAEDLAGQEGFSPSFAEATPIMALDATAINPSTSAAVPRVSVLAVDPSRVAVLGAGPALALDDRQAAVNQALADDLGLQTGQTIVVNLARASAAPAGSLFGRRDVGQTIERISLVVARIVPDEGMARFSLRSDRPRPRNVYVALDWFSRRVGREGLANVLLVAGGTEGRAEADVERLNGLLTRVVRPEDCGLRLVDRPDLGMISVESLNTVLSSRQAQAAGAAAVSCGYRSAVTSIYLANSIARAGASPEEDGIPYSTIAAMSPDAAPPLGPLVSEDGKLVATDLGADGILLNAWAAGDLSAKSGDTLDLSYYHIGSDATLTTDSRRFVVRGIVAMSGPAGDAELVPRFQGITDSTSISNWKPPFPINLKRIRPQDEKYWQEHKATPKAFISLEAARSLWSRPGQADAPWVTSVRVAARQGADAGPSVDTFAAALLKMLPPGEVGLTFRPVRADALRAAKGSSDFASLFLGLSSFLVLAAGLLVGLLMRLSVETRSRDAGLLLAVGFPAGTVARTLLAEGLLLAVVAAAVGVPLAVVYARGIMWALQTMWVDLLGPFALDLHVTAMSLTIGAAVGLVVALAAMVWALRILRRRAAVELLAGWQGLQEDAAESPRGRTPAIVSLLALAGAIAVLIVSLVTKSVAQTSAFFIVGGLMFVALLSATVAALGGGQAAPVHGHRELSLPRLAIRGARRRRSRSALTVALLACAAFTVVTVAANRSDLSRLDTSSRDSGAGGFALVADSELPIYVDLNTPAGRKAAGLNDEAAFEGVTVVSLRVQEGDDASCLNLQQPQSPKIVGLPQRFIDRGGFTFSQLAVRADDPALSGNPWRMLASKDSEGAVPVFGDEASVTWILKSGLHKTLTAPSPHGPVTLRIVGMLRGSIWQSELLMSEENLLQHFGDAGGYRRFLIEAPPERQARVAAVLRRDLGAVGLDVRRTADMLADYAGVQNTYLSAFHALGGLGLVLGTFAVVTVLLRNIVERRGELGLMLAVGFSRRQLVRLVATETVLLIAAGLAVGTIAGLVAVAPHVVQAKADVPWLSLGGTMGGIMLLAVIACAVATQRAVGPDLMAAIRSE